MNLRKFSPAILTLLVFLLAQGFGTALLFGIGMLTSPDFKEAVQAYISGATQGLPLLELLPVSTFSLILMAVDIFAVLCCILFLHNIRLATVFNISSLKWRQSLFAIAGGICGAISISILTETIEIPDVMLQTSLAMSHNFWGLLVLVIVGPVSEELLFREAITGEMLRRGANPWIAILVSALAFSTVHFNLAQGLYALPLGILFGIIYYKTGNIVLTSLLHILNNGIVVIQLFVLGEDTAELSYSDWLGGDLNVYTAMVCFGILCVVLMKYFYTYPLTEANFCPSDFQPQNDGKLSKELMQ